MMTSASFFFNDTATTEIYTLSLHDALPIYHRDVDDLGGRRPAGSPARPHLSPPRRHGRPPGARGHRAAVRLRDPRGHARLRDRKSTRLNSSHANISYAVFCLKKKKTLHTYE